MENITGSKFLDAFSAEWKVHLADHRDTLMAAYEENAAWTN